MLNPEDIQAPFNLGELTLDDVETWTPYLDVQFNGEVIPLHHFNTVVRLFETESANHAELRQPGQPVKGIRMAHDLLNRMVEYDYSYRWDKHVDDATSEWLATLESDDLEKEWEQYDLEAE